MSTEVNVAAMCGSREKYELFKVEWAHLCYKLNPCETNKQRLDQALAEVRIEE
ncbi:MAG: hypothetical protein IJZ53_07470 [Tyzzerella sp.]|nr:hypothetical protein [Tyzzerella sp.]